MALLGVQGCSDTTAVLSQAAVPPRHLEARSDTDGRYRVLGMLLALMLVGEGLYLGQSQADWAVLVESGAAPEGAGHSFVRVCVRCHGINSDRRGQADQDPPVPTEAIDGS
jgi:hypothetical protein